MKTDDRVRILTGQWRGWTGRVIYVEGGDVLVAVPGEDGGDGEVELLSLPLKDVEAK